MLHGYWETEFRPTHLKRQVFHKCLAQKFTHTADFALLTPVFKLNLWTGKKKKQIFHILLHSMQSL